MQPQIQFNKHQLLNKHFVQPEYGANYLEKRIEFTQLKSIHLYALEFGVNIRKRITKKLNNSSSNWIRFFYYRYRN